MRLIIKTRRVRLPADIKSQIPKKFLKFEKWIPESTILELTLSDDGRDKKATLNVDLPRYKMIHLEQLADEVMGAIDGAQKRLEIKLRKFRDKRLGQRRQDKIVRSLKGALVYFPRRIRGRSTRLSGARIVKRKKFDLGKPMTERQAIEQMKLSGHDFYIFRSAKTDKFAVVYRRDDGDFGLIECQ